ncbi:MAG: ABC transporter ATP-binding protein [Actinomycetota bacterium]|nr:ABC transporter ATP-binding protein [Actinomycetota bacterium]
MSETAIEVRGLAKRYRLGEGEALHGSLRDAIAGAATSLVHRARGRGRPKRDWIWALDHVSFDVEPGEVLGIIGRNGAGKTTLLKLLSSITDPTEGEARIWGRVGSLLEVGTGFHGDLTGRENIFLNGAILGMKRREIERKFDEIVEFAGVERFIDTPVKRYSSGMYLRLAFAVAAHLEPEILIVDEVLAVGDAEFQRKCLGKMGEVSGEGRTVLLVSHNMSAISSLATRCMWLDRGTIRRLGPPAEVVASYLSEGHTSLEPGFADLTDPKLRHGVPKQIHREILFESIRLVDGGDRTTGVFFEKEPMRIVMNLRARIAARRLELLCRVLSLEGTLVFTLASGVMDEPIEPGPLELAVEIPSLPLRRGNYAIDLYLMTHHAQDFLTGAIEFEVAGVRGGVEDPRQARDFLGLVDVEHEWLPIRQPDTTRTKV